MKSKSLIVGAALLMLTGGVHVAYSDALLFGDVENGEWLHTDKCAGCHTQRFDNEGEAVYQREDHKVKSIEGLMGFVEMCNTNSGAGLDSDQMDDVTAFLNDSYYHF